MVFSSPLPELPSARDDVKVQNTNETDMKAAVDGVDMKHQNMQDKTTKVLILSMTFSHYPKFDEHIPVPYHNVT